MGETKGREEIERKRGKDEKRGRWGEDREWGSIEVKMERLSGSVEGKEREGEQRRRGDEERRGIRKRALLLLLLFLVFIFFLGFVFFLFFCFCSFVCLFIVFTLIWQPHARDRQTDGLIYLLCFSSLLSPFFLFSYYSLLCSSSFHCVLSASCFCLVLPLLLCCFFILGFVLHSFFYFSYSLLYFTRFLP